MINILQIHFTFFCCVFIPNDLNTKHLFKKANSYSDSSRQIIEFLPKTPSSFFKTENSFKFLHDNYHFSKTNNNLFSENYQNCLKEKEHFEISNSISNLKIIKRFNLLYYFNKRLILEPTFRNHVAFSNDLDIKLENEKSRNSTFRSLKIDSTIHKQCGGKDSIMDIEGNSYPVVQIGTQCWTAENLKTSKFSNGSLIPNVIDTNIWIDLCTPAWCLVDNNPKYEDIYGKLYNAYAVADSRNLCPIGWHVSSTEEWEVLIDFLGGPEEAGYKLKTRKGWVDDYGEVFGYGSNQFGFSALPGGVRTGAGLFLFIGSSTLFWTSSKSTESNDSPTYYRITSNNDSAIRVSSISNIGGYVRCVMD